MVSIAVRHTRFLLSGFIVVLFSISYSGNGWAQDPGEQVFNTTCFACHTIGGGRLIGPDLAGVHEKRSQDWLEKFVSSSQSMINAGDAEAVALFEEYNSLLMPDAVASEEQVRQVLSYIKSQSSGDASSTVASAIEPVAPPEPASEEDILAGQELFQGNLRLENGGPACNACHEVRNDAVIGGGILAVELTTVFSRMGGAGVTAILGQAPFPVMQAAYEDRSLTDGEVAALVAFLEYADSEQYNQLPRDYGIGLFASGAVGAGILFFFFGFVWRGRKRGSVNQAIYDRQIRSVSDK
jgi:mono/diheme cytochrome c family protein